MGVQEDLDAVRVAFPGCSLLAFADLGARIVLVSSSAQTARRDALDGLCRDAAALFSASDTAQEARVDMGVRCSGGLVEVFLRDPERQDDALCAQCSAQTDIDGLLVAARGVLTSLSQEGEA